jgi:site-specific DNA-methyltransferase (adenine-specific)
MNRPPRKTGVDYYNTPEPLPEYNVEADAASTFSQSSKKRGVRVPVELQPGTMTVLDGRCRLQAARKAGLPTVPVVDANLNGDDPVIYLLRAASKRRNLTDDQRAMLADEEREWLAKNGREKQKAQGSRGQEGGRGKKKETLADAASARVSDSSKRDHSGNAREQAARAHNVSGRKAKQAQKVKANDPKLAAKVKAGEVPLAQAARQVDRERKRAELKAKADAARKAGPPGKPSWEIKTGDCLELFQAFPAGSARLLFADPPYNLGVDYGHGKKADQLPAYEYYRWCARWIHLCYDRLTPDGSLWLLINHEHAAVIELLLRGVLLDERLGDVLERPRLFHVRSWITWYETFGVNTAHGFNRCSRRLFHAAKDPRHFVFHADAVNRPSDRQAKYHDVRAEPTGKVWDDVWQIPRLVGTAKERLPNFPTQLPLALLLPIIGCASDVGDLVVDPFAGSGTTGEACLRLGRRFLGLEKSTEFVTLARQRLCAVHGEMNGLPTEAC